MLKGSTSITLTWDEIPCTDQNGHLLYYIISYTPDGGKTTTAALPIGNYQLTGLASCTRYTLMIAAENDAGIGDFSLSLQAITSGIGKV